MSTILYSLITYSVFSLLILLQHNTDTTFLKEFSVDSFKWRIPLDLVEKVDVSLTQEYYVVGEETGELHPDFQSNFKKKALHIEENGCKTRYAISTYFDPQGEQKKHVVIGINAKLLGARYLEGIRNENLGLVFSEIESHNIVEMDFERFLHTGLVSDCDFKKDIFLENDPELLTTKKLFIELKDRFQPIKSGHGIKSFNNKNNFGLQCGQRDSNQFRTQPFIKWYSKNTELLHNSKIFYQTHKEALGEVLENNIFRAEYNVKNKEHFVYSKLITEHEQTSLSNILNLNHNQLENLYVKNMDRHFFKRHMNKEIPEEIQPKDVVVINLIDALFGDGHDLSSIKDIYLSKLKKSNKTKYKDKFTDLLASYKGYFNKIQDIKIKEYLDMQEVASKFGFDRYL